MKLTTYTRNSVSSKIRSDNSRRLGQQWRIVGEQFRIVVAHHRGTGAGRHDHGPRLGKQIQLLARNCARLVRIAAVIGRLAAAGLLFGEMDFDAFALQQADGVQPGFRRELIDEAGGEKIDVGRLGRVDAGLLLLLSP